jgi:hypothetical protein
MEEEINNKEVVDSRRFRRENERVGKKLQKLMELYINFKNRNIVEKDSHIMLKPEVIICFDNLNQKWMDFCHQYPIDTKNTDLRNLNAMFRKSVDSHLEKHRELCWINFVLRYCKRYLKCSPTVTNIRSHYVPDSDAFLAAEKVKQETIDLMMNLLEIPARKIKKKYASCITELSHKEYIFYIDLVLQLRMNLINLKEFKTRLILRLVNVKSSKHYEKLLRMALKSEESMTVVDHIHANIHLLMDSIEGFFEAKEVDIPAKDENGDDIVKKEVQYFPVMEFTQNLQPWIKVPFLKYFKRKLYGPADAMANCTFYELRTAHDLLVEYANGEGADDMILSKLIGTLYRPKKLFLWIRKHLPKYNGDVRRPINSKSNESYLLKRAEKISKLPLAYKFGVFQFFKNVEEYLRYGTINIGDSSIELKVLYEKDSDFVSTGPDIGMSGILFNIAETGTLGPIDSVDNCNMYDILLLLYKSVKEANDRKATHEKMIKDAKP